MVSNTEFLWEVSIWTRGLPWLPLNGNTVCPFVLSTLPHICVCCIHVIVHTWMCVRRGQRLASGVFLCCSWPYFFETQGLLLKLELVVLTRCADQPAPKICLSPNMHTHTIELQVRAAMSDFHMNARDTNSGPCVCIMGILPTESSPKPPAFILHAANIYVLQVTHLVLFVRMKIGVSEWQTKTPALWRVHSGQYSLKMPAFKKRIAKHKWTNRGLDLVVRL